MSVVGKYLKKIVFISLLVIFLVQLAAETEEFNKTDLIENEKIIETFFTHLKNQEYSQVYELLDSEEKEGILFSDYLEYMNSFSWIYSQAKNTAYTLYAYLLENFLEYRIIETIKETEAVKIQLELTIPNFFAIEFDLADKIPEDTNQSPEIERKINLILKKLYPRGIPVDLKPVAYYIMTRDKEKYLITGIRDEILAFNVGQVKSAAFTARKAGKLEEAIILYKKALGMNAYDQEIKKALIECEAQLEERNRILSKTIAPYIKDHLIILEPVLSDTGWGETLSCTIKNRSTETIVYVKLRIIYYNDNDGIIDTYSFSPMDISSFDPLPPGAEIEISESIMFFPDTDNWSEKKFSLEIIDYKE